MLTKQRKRAKGERFYEPRSIKSLLTPKTRRTAFEIKVFDDAICALIEEIYGASGAFSLRHLFYRGVDRKLWPKLEKFYKQLIRRTGIMRRSGRIPFGRIADFTRYQRKPASHGSAADAVDEVARFYRRQAWRDQPVYCEIWCEKDALSPILYEITSKFDVPLMVTRGFPSLTFLQAAAESIREVGKPAYIYGIYDHDPAGVAIGKNVEQRIREFAPEAEIAFTRLAVTPDLIEELSLPTRPPKESDSRARTWTGGDCVEADAIDPGELKRIVQNAIVSHIDRDRWATIQTIEREERSWLSDIAAAMRKEEAA